MIRETSLAVDDLIYPAFVRHGRGIRDEISSMPGVYHFSVDTLVEEALAVAEDGIPAILLFGLPATKDADGSEAYADDGIVQQAVVAIKLEATIEELMTTIHAHPTLSEAMGEAALDVKGEAIHKMR